MYHSELIGPLRKTAPDSKQKKTLKRMYHGPTLTKNVASVSAYLRKVMNASHTPQKKHFEQPDKDIVSHLSGIRMPSSYESQKVLGKSVNPLKNTSTWLKDDVGLHRSRVVNKREMNLSLMDMIDRGTSTKQSHQKSISPAKLSETGQSWRVLGMNKTDKSMVCTPQFEKKQFFASYTGNPITGQGYQCFDAHQRRMYQQDYTSTKENQQPRKGGYARN